MIVLVIGGILGFLAWRFTKKNTKGNKSKVGFQHLYDETNLNSNRRNWTGKDVLESDLSGKTKDFQYQERKWCDTGSKKNKADYWFFNPKNGREHVQRVNLDDQILESAWNPLNRKDEAQKSKLNNAGEEYRKTKENNAPSLENTAFYRSNSSESRRKVLEFFAPFKKRSDYKDITDEDL